LWIVGGPQSLLSGVYWRPFSTWIRNPDDEADCSHISSAEVLYIPENLLENKDCECILLYEQPMLLQCLMVMKQHSLHMPYV
jgi:hypothetical protein